MKYLEMPKDIQEKIKELAPKYPLTLDEVTELYLMGEDHVDYLCQLKTMNVPDAYILLANQELRDEKNKKIWNELRGMDKTEELGKAWNEFIMTVCKELRIDKAVEWLAKKLN